MCRQDKPDTLYYVYNIYMYVCTWIRAQWLAIKAKYVGVLRRQLATRVTFAADIVNWFTNYILCDHCVLLLL